MSLAPPILIILAVSLLITMAIHYFTKATKAQYNSQLRCCAVDQLSLSEFESSLEGQSSFVLAKMSSHIMDAMLYAKSEGHDYHVDELNQRLALVLTKIQ
ncbi:hypothetical protein QMU85_000638 [Photobacterium damselae]|uniref:hypothetical protein n=1 Tax=Photobacterium damselae TaxID=38293 RepID=UPI00220CA970|nr:hypothetical protein [Photobacterium damselae]ELI6450256.1 hypothetical protein [Photobacterium damselae]ELV7515682.1 hypothetical protein [Photobacterium damselae]BDR36060.1 hypothetical protein PDY_31080 [Photobacterium damselae subsp. damselae]